MQRTQQGAEVLRTAVVTAVADLVVGQQGWPVVAGLAAACSSVLHGFLISLLDHDLGLGSLGSLLVLLVVIVGRGHRLDRAVQR